MEIQPDFRDLLALFDRNGVECLIVGAYALARHGAPRYTGDLDILVHADTANAARILKSLKEFGFGSLGLKAEDFQQPGQVVQLGFPPVRIDLLTSITGVSWEEALAGSVEDFLGDLPVRYLGIRELIRNKKALARKKDLADLEAIGAE
ncbi:MAG: nucleotidyltransferase family protein [Acidobacteria bacterium]|nr:nucleotidyltransferase family protein [Acidobacteriota bacterium]